MKESTYYLPYSWASKVVGSEIAACFETLNGFLYPPTIVVGGWIFKTKSAKINTLPVNLGQLPFEGSYIAFYKDFFLPLYPI